MADCKLDYFCTSNCVFWEQMCPVCAAKIPKDMVGHISLQHGHLFQISFDNLLVFEVVLIYCSCIIVLVSGESERERHY